VIFRFIRNRLAGSYFAFSAASRSEERATNAAEAELVLLPVMKGLKERSSAQTVPGAGQLHRIHKRGDQRVT
jgi:hypothetical protein